MFFLDEIQTLNFFLEGMSKKFNSKKTGINQPLSMGPCTTPPHKIVDIDVESGIK